MSGVVAVVLLLFVSAAIRIGTEANELERLQRLEKEADAIVMSDVMKSVESSLAPFKMSMGLIIDHSRNTILLPAGTTFESRSAIPNDVTKSALTSMSLKLLPHLQQTARLGILVEGHADGARVMSRLPCGADDNYTLSAFRARNARNIILRTLGDKYKLRIGIAAYGESRPLVKDVYAAENRRVEIRFELSPVDSIHFLERH